MPSMIRRGLAGLTGEETPVRAWRSLIATQDVVGIKVLSAPGSTAGTRPAVVEAVVQGLIDAGLPPKQIVVWDKRLADLRQAGFFSLAERHGIQVAGAMDAGFDESVFYESAILGRLVWGDLEFGGKGEGVARKSFFSKLVTQQFTRIITVTPLLNHNVIGVSGNLWGLAMGSVDNTLRFEGDAARLAVAVPEILVCPVRDENALADLVVLNITDALVCQYYGAEEPRLHYASPLNQLWFSRDPVALDVLAIQELERQRKRTDPSPTRPNLDLYKNASLLGLGVNDPSLIDVIHSP